MFALCYSPFHSCYLVGALAKDKPPLDGVVELCSSVCQSVIGNVIELGIAVDMSEIASMWSYGMDPVQFTRQANYKPARRIHGSVTDSGMNMFTSR
jgi:hypothetical protein